MCCFVFGKPVDFSGSRFLLSMPAYLLSDSQFDQFSVTPNGYSMFDVCDSTRHRVWLLFTMWRALPHAPCGISTEYVRVANSDDRKNVFGGSANGVWGGWPYSHLNRRYQCYWRALNPFLFFFFYPLWVRQRLLGQQIFTIHLSASVNLRIMLWYYCEWYDWMHTNKKYKQNRKHVWRKCVFTFNLMFYIPSMFLFGCTFCGAVAICPKAALISICCLSLLVSYFSICSVEYHSELLTNLIFHKDQSILISLNFSSAHSLLFSVWHHQMLFIFALRLSVCT